MEQIDKSLHTHSKNNDCTNITIMSVECDTSLGNRIIVTDLINRLIVRSLLCNFF